jgi:hypothetical protein
VTCRFSVGVAGFEPAASSSRSQRAMWPTTTLTLSDLPRAVRGHPLVSVALVSFSYSPVKGRGGWWPLWQLDVTDSAFLSGGTERKLISGIDDRSPGSA